MPQGPVEVNPDNLFKQGTVRGWRRTYSAWDLLAKALHAGGYHGGG